MKALIQRVSAAKVWIGNSVYNEIGCGVVVFLGVRINDNIDGAAALAAKTAHLRIFPDEQDRMNRSLLDISGEALVISQFTLYADTRKGNRPSFIYAAPPTEAELLYQKYVQYLTDLLPSESTKTGQFRASMQVELINDGPVTITLDTDNQLPPCR